MDYVNNAGSLTRSSNGSFYVISQSGEKRKVSAKYSDIKPLDIIFIEPVSYTHLRAHET